MEKTHELKDFVVRMGFARRVLFNFETYKTLVETVHDKNKFNKTFEAMIASAMSMNHKLNWEVIFKFNKAFSFHRSSCMRLHTIRKKVR